MRLNKYIIVFILLFSCSAWAADPLIPSQDMTYSGAFKLPDPNEGYQWSAISPAGYNKPGMCWHHGNNTLLMLATKANPDTEFRYAIEITPAALKTDTYTNLNTGSISHAETDITNSLDVDLDATRLIDVFQYSNQGSQTDDKIYLMLNSGYTEEGVTSLVSGPLAWVDDDYTDWHGWWDSALAIEQYAGYIFAAPDSWATTNTSGKSLMVGTYRGGGGPYKGPTIVAMAPWDQCTGDPIDCDATPPADGTNMNYQVLLRYSNDVTDTDNIIERYSQKDRFSDAVWITVGGKETVIFYGYDYLRSPVTNSSSYPSEAPEYQLSSIGEGYGEGMGRPCLYFFDPDDLAAVAAGGNTYDPHPYAIMDLSPYFYEIESPMTTVYGMAWDSDTNKLYLHEHTSTPNHSAVMDAVHVFTLADTGSSLDTTDPSTPVVTIGSVSNDSAAISWTQSEDDRADDTDITYVVYKAGYPVHVTTDESWTDTLYEWYTAPVSYYVVAYDDEGNTATSNTVWVGEDDGGNVPLSMFFPSLATTSEHETSNLPYITQNVAYSFTPTGIGGTTPYVWSMANEPTGLSINSSTGEISGTVASTGSDYDPIITLTDDNGNIHRRRVKMTTRASSSTDLDDADGDGYDNDGAGGSDTNDDDCNSSPGNPTQPAPTNLVHSSTSGIIATLTWTEAVQRTGISLGLEDTSFYANRTTELHHGTATGTYSTDTFVGSGETGDLTVVQGDNYIAATAYAFRGLESANSDELHLSMLGGNAYGAYGSEGADGKVGITETNDGGVVLASYSDSYTWVDSDNDRARIYLVKANSDGVEQWDKVYDLDGSVLSQSSKHVVTGTSTSVATGVIETGTDDLIICGYQGTDSEGVNLTLFKTDDEGTLTWYRSLNRTGSTNDSGYAVIENLASGFAIAGQSYNTSTDAALILTSATGESPSWTLYNTNGNGWETARQIRQTSDGGYILVGWTEDGVGGDEDYYVVKTTSDGTLSWAQKYDNSERKDKAYGIEEDGSGNFWIIGRSQKAGVENTNIYIVKTNSSGVEQANYSIGDDVDANAYIARNSQLLSNGHLLIVGYTNVTSGDGYDGYLAQVGTDDGAVDWSTTVSMDQENHEDYLQECVVSGDGNNYLCAGTNNSAVSNYYDLWHVKVAASDRAVGNLTECTSKSTYYMDPGLDGVGEGESCSLCFAMDGYSQTQAQNGHTISANAPAMGISAGAPACTISSE